MTSRKQIDGDYIYDIFHENSKNFTLDEPNTRQTEQSSTKYKPHKSYESQNSLSIQVESSDISEIIFNRRSPDSFEDYTISKQQALNVLGAAIRITKRNSSEQEYRRSYPSAGAKYPLEAYSYMKKVDGIEKGIYHIDVLNEELVPIPSKNEGEIMNCISGDLVKNTSMIVFLSAIFEKTVPKYASRGYRYALIEAGHIMQNICITSEDNDLCCRPYGGFIEDEVDNILNLPDDETTIYLGLIGKS